MMIWMKWAFDSEMKKKAFCFVTFILFFLKNCYGLLKLMTFNTHIENKFYTGKGQVTMEKDDRLLH